MKAYLTLANGEIFAGESIGAVGEALGEVVFTTGSTGYLETLTDPSYYGQVVVQTFPQIGNYGVVEQDFESELVVPNGYIVKDLCNFPSNFRSSGALGVFLKDNGIVGIANIDTRHLTKIIRECGVMNGLIAPAPCTDLEKIRNYVIKDAVKNVTKNAAANAVLAEHREPQTNAIAMVDFGAKNNIAKELEKRGFTVNIFHSSATAKEIAASKPIGIMLSNGPGNPADNTAIIAEIAKLCKLDVPIFGICLGHQLLALAHGFKTVKLKYGHRGANQPVKDLTSGRVYITSQNHGYAVDGATVNEAVATEFFVNVNDKSNEGIIYKNASIFSVQFHPEACGGPLDTTYLFDFFIKRLKGKIK